VLRDIDANLILDFIRLAAPPLVPAAPAKR